MTLAAGDALGSYQIVEQVGRGGMATVYKALQPTLSRYVAIKVLPEFFAEDQTFRERFQREAIAVAGLRHANILTVFDYGEERGLHYIVAEYVDGGTLAGQIGQPLPLEYTVQMLAPVASALDYAHARGIVHRDVKPSNILLTRDGTPVLSDFGLAAMMGSLPRLTMTGSPLGTPDYMSPEQANGQTPGPQTDLYALAVIAYEMLTGRMPFQADTPLAVLLAHIDRPVPPPRDMNPALAPEVDPVLLKALAKEPADRYPAGAAFIAALGQAAAEPAAQPEAVPAPVGQPSGTAASAPAVTPAAMTSVPAGPSLVWEREGEPPIFFPIPPSATIGRVESNDIVIPDTAASRQHARLELSGDCLTVYDLGTLNGTTVNGTRITDATAVTEGDVIGIGHTVLRVHVPGPAAASLEETVVLAAVDAHTALAEMTQVMAAPGHAPELVEPATPAPPEPVMAGYLLEGDARTPLYDSLTIGRGEDAGLRITTDRTVSRRHAQVEVRPDGVWVTDLASTHGTYVNGVRIAGPTRISASCELRLGDSVLHFEPAPEPAPTGRAVGDEIDADSDQTMVAPLPPPDTGPAPASIAASSASGVRVGDATDRHRLIVNFGPQAGRQFILDQDVIVIGRAGPEADSNIQLDDRAASSPHAEIVREPEGFVLRDLGSANGTWLNHKDEVTSPCRLRDGDAIKIGQTTLLYRVPAGDRPAEREVSLDPTAGQVVTLFSLKGGAGTTTIAVNLALALRQVTQQPVALVDLSAERGAVAIHLNLVPRRTLSDLPADPSTIDVEVLRAIILSHESGVDLLPAPTSPETAELVTAPRVAASLPILRGHYKWVVVDTSASFSDLNLSLFDQSDLVILVSTPDIVGLKVARAALDIFAALHLPGEKRIVALNQPQPHAHLNVEDVEQTLGERISLAVPYGGERALEAIDRGVPLLLAGRDHPVVAPIVSFAAKLAQVKSEAGPGGPRLGLGRWVQSLLGSRRG